MSYFLMSHTQKATFKVQLAECALHSDEPNSNNHPMSSLRGRKDVSKRL